MDLSDDDSLLSVVVIPAMGGIAGLVLFGPLGFFAVVVVLLVLGANTRTEAGKADEQRSDLDARLEEPDDTN